MPIVFCDKNCTNINGNKCGLSSTDGVGWQDGHCNRYKPIGAEMRVENPHCHKSGGVWRSDRGYLLK